MRKRYFVDNKAFLRFFESQLQKNECHRAITATFAAEKTIKNLNSYDIINDS